MFYIDSEMFHDLFGKLIRKIWSAKLLFVRYLLNKAPLYELMELFSYCDFRDCEMLHYFSNC